ncbi:hypothetical protein ACFW2X_07970 [Streptomyces antibioticus]|uniref:hypothetical protein n=1 Tax=Streptomyces antibioticus TaxID=1890 RepID=UPI0036922D31
MLPGLTGRVLLVSGGWGVTEGGTGSEPDTERRRELPAAVEERIRRWERDGDRTALSVDGYVEAGRLVASVGASLRGDHEVRRTAGLFLWYRHTAARLTRRGRSREAALGRLETARLDVPERPPPAWFPLHAAGHRPGAVMDRVVSSYTPTLRALASARPARRGSDGRPGPRTGPSSRGAAPGPATPGCGPRTSASASDRSPDDRPLSPGPRRRTPAGPGPRSS